MVPFFAFRGVVRRINCAAYAIEVLNPKLRRAVHVGGYVPSDAAPTTLLCLMLNRSMKEWEMPLLNCLTARAYFAVMFGERFMRTMAT